MIMDAVAFDGWVTNFALPMSRAWPLYTKIDNPTSEEQRQLTLLSAISLGLFCRFNLSG